MAGSAAAAPGWLVGATGEHGALRNGGRCTRMGGHALRSFVGTEKLRWEGGPTKLKNPVVFEVEPDQLGLI